MGGLGEKPWLEYQNASVLDICERVERFAASPGWLVCEQESRHYSLQAYFHEEINLTHFKLGDLPGRAFETLFGRATPRQLPSPFVQAAIAKASTGLGLDSDFLGVQHFAGFHSEFAETWSELRNRGVIPDDLRDVANQAPDHLQQKIHSIVDLIDRTDQVISPMGYSLFSEILFGFIHRDIEALSQLPPILVVLDEPPPDLYIEFFESLHPICEVLKVLVCDQHGTVADSSLYGSVSSGNPYQGNVKVEVNSHPDVLCECEATLNLAQKWIHEGISPEEIEIFCSDLPKYTAYLSAVGQRLNLPLSIDVQLPVLEHRFTAFLLDLIRALASSDVRTLIPLLESSFAQVAPEHLGDLRKLVEIARNVPREFPELQWQILDQSSPQHEKWVPWLRPVLDLRSQMASGRKPLREFYGHLKDLLDIVPPPNQSVHEIATATRIRQAILKAVNVHASFDGIGPNWTPANRDSGAGPAAGASAGITLLEFSEVVGGLWKNATYYLPKNEEAIRVVSSRSALLPARRLIGIGLIDGALPKRIRERPLLSEQDRSWLNDVFEFETPLEQRHHRNLSELTEFYALFGAASEGVVLSYPRSTGEQDAVASCFLSPLSLLIPNLAHHSFDFQALALSTELGADTTESNRNSSQCPADESIDPFENSETLDMGFLETSPIFEELTRTSLSPPRIRELLDWMECPFQGFVRNFLSLHGQESASYWWKLLELPERAKLLCQESEASAQAELENQLARLLDEIRPIAQDWEVHLVETSARLFIPGWVEREFASRIQWPRVPNSTVFHAKLGENGIRDDAVTLPLRDEIGSISQLANGTVAVHLYRLSLDIRNFVSASLAWTRATNEAWLMGLLAHREAVPMSLMMDYSIGASSPSGGSQALLTTDKRPLPSGGRFYQFSFMGDKVQRIEFAKIVKQSYKRRQEMKIILSPNLDVCSKCSFIDLCRTELDEIPKDPVGGSFA